MTHVPYSGFLGLLGISFYMMMTFNESRQDSKPNHVCIAEVLVFMPIAGNPMDLCLWIFLTCVGVVD